jgi:hypothetical protein
MKHNNKNVTGSERLESTALARIDDLEISPLSDAELDSVAGGHTDDTTAASCACCVSGATEIILIPVPN